MIAPPELAWLAMNVLPETLAAPKFSNAPPELAAVLEVNTSPVSFIVFWFKTPPPKKLALLLSKVQSFIVVAAIADSKPPP